LTELQLVAIIRRIDMDGDYNISFEEFSEFVNPVTPVTPVTPIKPIESPLSPHINNYERGL